MGIQRHHQPLASTGMTNVPITKNGQPIRTLDDWFDKAPPALGKLHWKDFRSAKELARRWLKGFPEEVRTVLELAEPLRGMTFEFTEPEHSTALDEFPRPRVHDLLLVGTARGGRIVIGVEGKADEPFGKLISEELVAAPLSNKPERIRRLLAAVFVDPTDQALGTLRYQLLHALAGTLIEAHTHQADWAVLLVHEFTSHATKDSDIRRNGLDLENFITALEPHAWFTGPSGFLAGPIAAPGGGRIPAFGQVYIAKATVGLSRE